MRQPRSGMRLSTLPPIQLPRIPAAIIIAIMGMWVASATPRTPKATSVIGEFLFGCLPSFHEGSAEMLRTAGLEPASLFRQQISSLTSQNRLPV